MAAGAESLLSHNRLFLYPRLLAGHYLEAYLGYEGCGPLPWTPPEGGCQVTKQKE